jgi:hypothetical protein
MDEPLWTLRELTAEVAAQLERNYEAADNGQVRAIPDERSIRYYTTLGLVDRPAAMRGRTALYGRRHLAQLVAIKRLQALGKPLAEIQRLLPTLDDATLSRVSGVVVSSAPRTRTDRPSFWKGAPASSPALAPVPLPVPLPGSSGFLATWSLPLAPGVTLTVTPARAPTDADADAIRRAAAALLVELARRGLTPTDETRETEETV